jgi:SAM-dependent methyltransferase
VNVKLIEGVFDDPQSANYDYQVAEAIAPTWERRREFVEGVCAPVRQWLVRELAPAGGETALELAAGVGDTGFEVARELGADGHLISSDFSPRMCDAARRRAAELGLENVDVRVIDAGRIELDDDSVDAVICRFGYMLMPDPAVALAETRRVLRDGGRLALAVWGPPEQNPFFVTAGVALVDAGHVPPPDPDAPDVFSLGAEDRVRQLLEGAGFNASRIEAVPVSFPLESPVEYLEIVADTGGALGLAVRALDDGPRRELVGAFEEALQPYAADGGYRVPGLALCARAS